MTLLLNGLVIGAVYGLTAASFAVVLRATHTLNLLTVAFFVIAPFVIYQITGGTQQPLLSFLLWVIVAAGAMAALSWLTYWGVLRRLQDAPFFVVIIATAGIGDAYLALAASRDEWVLYPVEVGSPYPNQNVDIAGSLIATNSLLGLALAAVAFGGVVLLIERSRWGLAFRATSSDRQAAGAVGIDLARVTVLAWLACAVLAAVAGIITGMFPRILDLPSRPAIAFRALPAAVIGGVDSITGAALGGLLVGVLEAVVARYAPGYLGSNLHLVAPYILVFVILRLFPQGLFGRREVRRV